MERSLSDSPLKEEDFNLESFMADKVIYDLFNLQFDNLQCTIDLQFSNLIIYRVNVFNLQFSIYEIYDLRFIYDLVI